MEYPWAAARYPRSADELRTWFRAEKDCLDYLDWVRWPGGFTCPVCGHAGGWRLRDARYECAGCSQRTSVTAGTIFDRTRTPLTVWFGACWQFATRQDGISAVALQRSLGIGSYQTSWAILHRLRSVLACPARDLLGGVVEIDQAFIGGQKGGPRGGQAGGGVLTGLAVEVSGPEGTGRCRIQVLPDDSARSVNQFAASVIEPGTRVATGASPVYSGLAGLGYVHERRADRTGQDRPDELLPAAHQVASLARRWMQGNQRRPVDQDHLPAYLNEFAYRFSQRRSASRGLAFYGLLELAVAHAPVRLDDLLASKRPPASRSLPAHSRRPGRFLPPGPPALRSRGSVCPGPMAPRSSPSWSRSGTATMPRTRRSSTCPARSPWRSPGW